MTNVPTIDEQHEEIVRLREQLTRAKNLLVRLHGRFPETRSMIEGHTGSWFVWGDNRSEPVISPPVAAVPVTAIEAWLRPDHLRLHAGEVTAQEIRTVQAVLRAILRESAREAALSAAGFQGLVPDTAAIYEQCAKIAETLTYRSRWAKGASNALPIEPCQIAAAIRKAATS